MTLCDDNAMETDDFLKLSALIGVDGCTLLPQASFRDQKKRSFDIASEAALKLAALSKDPRIDNSRNYLRGAAAYLKGGLMPSRCSALHTSVLVSPDRKLYPCVPASILDCEGIPYRKGNLMDVFNSGALSRCITEQLCNNCWWNCHRELDLTLGVI